MWILFATLSAFFAALVTIFGKIGVKDMDPIAATAIRSIIMALFVVSTAFIMGKFKGDFSVSGREWIIISLAGISGAISWIFYFLALKGGDATKVAVIDRMSLVFIVIMAALFLAEGLTWKTIAGSILIVAGAVIMALF